MRYKFAPGCTTCMTILASPGMEEVAKNVHRILTDPNGKYKDDRFDYACIPRSKFPGDELYPNLGKIRIKNKDIFLFHPMREDGDPNTSMIQLYLTIDALARATINNVTLVLPYPSYFRQDRKDKPRVPISAKALADMLTIKPIVKRIIIMDMHSDQGQGFFNVPVDNLQGSRILAEYLVNELGDEIENCIAVSPDHGGSKRNRRFAKYMKIPDTSLEKWRDEKGVEIPKVPCPGEFAGKTILLFDDEAASGETSITAGKIIMECHAKSAYLIVSHWIACKKNGIKAEDRFKEAYEKYGLKVICTNSIPRPKEYLDEHAKWLTMIKADDLYAHTIYQGTLIGGSISEMFEQPVRTK
ncbi:MAG: ribose-phosphate pyrophosphokinase [Candidatus Vogelbacteria bacterium]|nr:ribose-phosphate pyrophosphokinase [Candidatus Vogelbacteria bacterium]